MTIKYELSKKQGENKKNQILVRISVSRNFRVGSKTGLYVSPKDWNDKTNTVRKISNTLFALITPLRMWAMHFTLFGTSITFGAFDFVGLIILVVLLLIYLNNFKHDAETYAKLDPAKPRAGN